MEETPKNIKSRYLSRPDIQRQFELLNEVMEEGKKRVDWETAHDEQIVHAIQVIERFLRKRHRLCYGGQAINSLLPTKHRFYDSRYTIPDYDFFTPDLEGDTKEILDMLKEEGFIDINYRVGIHEGSRKINVNFVPVADITEMHEDTYTILSKRAPKVDGISYCDPDYLRMNMHLELSRPRGQVDRWNKVYERLLLLNRSFPIETCHNPLIVKKGIAPDVRKEILSFCITNKRPLAGIEAIAVLEKQKSNVSLDTLVNLGGPVIFFSSNASLDARDIVDRLKNGKKFRIEDLKNLTEDLLSFTAIYKGSTPIALIAQETACHAYTLLRLESGEEMRISLHDTLMHMYYNLYLFGKKEKAFFEMSMECLIQKIYQIMKKAREFPTKFVPAFGLRCSGRQKGIKTLRKERQIRTEEEKKRLSNEKKQKTKTKTKKVKRV
jgi:hypothetical protein